MRAPRSLRIQTILALSAAAILLTSCSIAGSEVDSGSSPESTTQQEPSPTPTEDESASEKDPSSVQTESTPASQEPAPSQTKAGSAFEDESEAGSYIDLTSYESNRELYADSKVVLFFNAAWCSTCEVARNNFEATKASFPSNLTIVVVDFDDSIDLRKKYGVTIQHTFVQINTSGEQLGKWSGSVTVDQIVGNTI